MSPHKFKLFDINAVVKEKSKFMHIPFIKESIISTVNVTYTYKNNNINLTLYQTCDKITPTKNIQKKLTNTVNTVIDFFEIKNANVFIYITLNSEKKIFPVGKVIDASNVNNGVTFYFRKHELEEKFIYIYRYEDMYKVLIHELIHYFKKDLDHVVNNDNIIMSLFDVRDESGEINLTEAYTETLACFIYVTRIVNKNKSIGDFKSVVDYYKDRLLRIAKAQVEHCKKYKVVYQKSHMFSYYICRGLLFASVDKFLVLFMKKDKKGLENLIMNNFKYLEKVRPLKIMHL